MEDGVGKVKSRFQEVAGSLAKVGAVATGIGGAFTVAGAKLDDAQKTLQRVIENSGFDYDKYSDKIDAAIETQARFGHSSTEVQSVLANLTLKLKDPQKALDALGLAADIAALKNISLADASVIVSKALSGNKKVLAGFGIAIEDVKKATSDAEKATKDHAGAQETLGEATQNLSDLQATLAEKQKLGVSDTIALREATQELAEARKSGDASDIAEAEERLADVQARIAEGARLTTSEQLRLRDAQNAVLEATKNLESATTNMTGAQAYAKDAAGASGKAIDELKAKVGGMAKEEAETLRGKLEGLKTSFGNVVATVGDKVGPAFTVASGILTVAGGVAANYSAIMEALPAIQKLVAIAQGALNAVMSANPIALLVLAIVALIAIFVLAWQHSETFRDIVRGAMDAVKNAVQAVFNWFKDNWPLLLAILTGPIGLAVLAIVKNWDTIKAAALALKDFVVDKFNAVVDFFTGMPEKISKAASGMWDGIKNAFKSVINWIIRAWNGLEFGIPGFDPPGPGPTFPGFTLGVPNIPLLAQGGPVLPGRPYIVGERQAELFVPNSAGRVLPDVGSGIVVNSTINVAGGIADEASFRRILDARDRELINSLRAGYR